MLDAIDRIMDYTQPGERQFRADRKTQDAVLRNLETLGEATKRLDDQTRAPSPKTRWREISGLRDVLANDYVGNPHHLSMAPLRAFLALMSGVPRLSHRQLDSLA